MSRTPRQLKELTLEYLLEINAGTCSITDAAIEREEDLEVREMMAGFLFLHEELELQRRHTAKAHAELRAAKDAAEASNEAKSRFLANVSHELRTPMNGVLGMTELLMQAGLSQEQRRYAQAILSSARSLLAVINDVLDMAKIESGRFQICEEPFDLGSAVAGLMERFALQAGSRGLWLHHEVDPELPRYVMSDEGRLVQILTNYLGNALKFTRRGAITLALHRERGPGGREGLRFDVTDTGIGIAADKLGLLFQPFSQVDPTMTREFSGTGLGLAICRQLAELLGGEVGVHSEVGRGSTFWLRLPLVADPERGQPRLAAGRRSWPPRAALDDAEDDVERPSGTARGVARVLVVDDNRINRIIAVRMLQGFGCRVEVAEDGEQGLRRVEQGTYDLVFMDCQMPRMDGFEATAAIRERVEFGPQIPIIAMTAHAMAGDRERCLAAGMDDYISKPVTREAVEVVLRRYGALEKGEGAPRTQAAGCAEER